MAHQFDFSGWATRNNIKCSDGRVIKRDAFKDNDCDVVPLMWNHDHSSPASVVGHALLENRAEGVYAYCALNNSENGLAAKEAVKHGDIEALSIYANGLTQNGSDVIHGNIREVSLVMHGANPGAYIDNIIAHSDGTEAYGEQGFVYNDEIIDTETQLFLCHDEEGNLFLSDKDEDFEPEEDDDEYLDSDADLDEDDDDDEDDEFEHADKDDSNKTVADVINSMTEEQKQAMYFLIGEALKNNKSTAKHSDDNYEEDENTMKHNVFDQDTATYNTINSTDANALMHGEELRSETAAIFAEAPKKGSLRETVLAHANTYGIKDIDWLFPDARTMTAEPEFVSRDMAWVTSFLNGVKKSPFTRIKMLFADITADEARARGYITGNIKAEEVFKLLRRIITPTTVYKKQKLDRDDVLDITSFDVVAYIRREMRVMLNEEIAVAALIGDGRDPLTQADDKINEDCIVPIYTDRDLFSIKVSVPVAAADTSADKAKNLIEAVIRARKDYKGSGNPVFYTTAETLADLLLVEDGIGRRLYRTKEELATAMLVRDVVTVEPMIGRTRTVGEGASAVVHTLAGIIVNPADYVIGTDRGGEINTFDDFDIDYNQMKYLMETRCSGALTKPYSAMVIEYVPAQG